MTEYGNRDKCDLDAQTEITRPDGTTFIQGDPSTYRKTILPDVPRPPWLSLRWDGSVRDVREEVLDTPV